MAKTKLTAKQQRFAEYYDGNGTEAAIKAGYSAKTADAAASRLLKDVRIASAIAKRERKTIKKSIIMDREARQAMWSEMASNPDLKPQDRLRAAELLGKSEGDFLDKLQVSGQIEIKGLVFKPYKSAQVNPE